VRGLFALQSVAMGPIIVLGLSDASFCHSFVSIASTTQDIMKHGYLSYIRGKANEEGSYEMKTCHELSNMHAPTVSHTYSEYWSTSRTSGLIEHILDNTTKEKIPGFDDCFFVLRSFAVWNRCVTKVV
jgi:hypothetical protein